MELHQKKNLIVALVFAALLHILILAIKISYKVSQTITQTEGIHLQIYQTDETKENEQTAEVNNPSARQEPLAQKDPLATKEQFREDPLSMEKTITNIKPEVSDTPEITSATLLHNEQYRQFLKSETDRHIVANPSSLERFDQSFELPIEQQEPDLVAEINNLQTGYYVTKVNGKTRCNIQVVMPYNDDWSGNVNLSKDCSVPEKTFELK